MSSSALQLSNLSREPLLDERRELFRTIDDTLGSRRPIRGSLIPLRGQIEHLWASCRSFEHNLALACADRPFYKRPFIKLSMSLGSWGLSFDEYGRSSHTISQTRTLLESRVHKLVEKTLSELKEYEQRNVVDIKYYETLEALEPTNKRIGRRFTQLLFRKNVAAAAQKRLQNLDEGRNIVVSYVEKMAHLERALWLQHNEKEIGEVRDDLNFFLDYLRFLIRSRDWKSADAKIGELLVAYSPDDAPQNDSPLFYEWRSMNHTLKMLLAESAMGQGNFRRALSICETLSGQIGEFETNREKAIERHIQLRLQMASFSARTELSLERPRNGFFLKEARDMYLQALRMQEDNVSSDIGDFRFWIWLLVNQAKLRAPSNDRTYILHQAVRLIAENRISPQELIPWLQKEVKVLKEKTDKFKSDYFSACAQKLTLSQEAPNRADSGLEQALLDSTVAEMLREFEGRDEVGSGVGLDMQITLFRHLILNLQNVPAFELHSELYDMQTDIETLSDSLTILRRTSSLLFQTASTRLPALAGAVARFALPAPAADFIMPQHSSSSSSCAPSAPPPRYGEEDPGA
jgi:tetratricopeptide (TPR) repeat protein